MEDNIDTHLFNRTSKLIFSDKPNPRLPWVTSGIVASVYGLWAIFVLPGFRKVPWILKVPFLPSSKSQTANVVALLKGRKGRLADLGSGDGRLVFAAASMGFQGIGYEINPILVTWAKTQAWWKGISDVQATFVKKDFWAEDLSSFNNVTIFLTSSAVIWDRSGVKRELRAGVVLINGGTQSEYHGVRYTGYFSKENLIAYFEMEALEEKLSSELPDDARVIACRFPFPHWPPICTQGSGLDQVWAYDMSFLKKGGLGHMKL